MSKVGTKSGKAGGDKLRKCASQDCQRRFDPQPQRRVAAPGGGWQWVPYAGSPKEFCSQRCATRERVRQFRARARGGL